MIIPPHSQEDQKQAWEKYPCKIMMGQNKIMPSTDRRGFFGRDLGYLNYDSNIFLAKMRDLVKQAMIIAQENGIEDYQDIDLCVLLGQDKKQYVTDQELKEILG